MRLIGLSIGAVKKLKNCLIELFGGVIHDKIMLINIIIVHALTIKFVILITTIADIINSPILVVLED